MNAVRKAEQSVIKFQLNQLRIINCTCFIVMHRMGWSAEQIAKRFDDATEIWNECREKKISTLKMLEDEADITMALEFEKDYKEFYQLFYHNDEMTPAQYIYSLHRRKRWIAPMILSAFMMALYRVDKWDAEQLAEFAGMTDELRREYGEDVEALAKAMESETGFTPKLWEE